MTTHQGRLAVRCGSGLGVEAMRRMLSLLLQSGKLLGWTKTSPPKKKAYT